MVRRMGDLEVIQRTSDGMFNATLLMNQWNVATGQSKEVNKFFDNENTKEFISALMSEGNLNTQNSAYLTSRGKHGGTWMHPYLFVKFAMWLSPRFEVKVIKFVYDEMIKYRHEAGDNYLALGSAIQKIVPRDFMPKAMQKVGEALNWIVFGKHEDKIRNKFGNEQTQRELSALEKKVSDLINEGFITEYNQVIAYLRRRYHEKNYPKVFTV
jgi:hypothetical protein